MNIKKLIILAISFIFSVTFFEPAWAQEELRNFAEGLPALTIKNNGDSEQTYSLSLQILALMTGLTLLPSIVLGATSFTRIIIVLSILRQAMGTATNPSQSSINSYSTVFNFLYNDPDFNRDQ